MSSTMRWVLVTGFGLIAAAIVYVISEGDVVWSIVALLVAFTVGRAVAHPGSA